VDQKTHIYSRAIISQMFNNVLNCFHQKVHNNIFKNYPKFINTQMNVFTQPDL